MTWILDVLEPVMEVPGVDELRSSHDEDEGNGPILDRVESLPEGETERSMLEGTAVEWLVIPDDAKGEMRRGMISGKR